MRNIASIAELVYVSTGSYPKSLAELKKSEHAKNTSFFDSWGQEYGYEIRDGKPIITSLGKDKAEGGEGEDMDVVFPPPVDEGF